MSPKKGTNMKLSIIVPVHDGEPFIDRCLNALIDQGVVNYEIVCVENGSADDSLRMLQQYESQHPEIIKVFSLTESGVSLARNYGIEHSTGEVLAFCDVDDYVIPKAYGYLLDTYWHDDIDLVKYNSVTLDEHMLNKWKETNDVRGDLLFEGNTVDFIKQCGCCPTFVWCHLYSRSFIERHKIRYESIIIGEDLTFNLTVYSARANMLAVSSNIYRYTVSSQQVTRIRQKDKMRRISMGYIKVFEMLVRCKTQIPEIEFAMNRQIESEMLASFSRAFSADLNVKDYRFIWKSFKDLGIWDMKKTRKYTRCIDIMMSCYPLYKLMSVVFRNVFVPYILPKMSRN